MLFWVFVCTRGREGGGWSCWGEGEEGGQGGRPGREGGSE